MMDANYVHQRDVANILENLHQQIEEANKDKGKIPDEVLTKKIKDLISSADRDLRLKTQSIMRTRLTQSNTIPVNFAPLVQLDGHPFQTPYVPLPDPKTQTNITFTNMASTTPRVKRREQPISSTSKTNLGSRIQLSPETSAPLYGFNPNLSMHRTKPSSVPKQDLLRTDTPNTVSHFFKKSTKQKNIQSNLSDPASKSQSPRAIDHKSASSKSQSSRIPDHKSQSSRVQDHKSISSKSQHETNDQRLSKTARAPNTKQTKPHTKTTKPAKNPPLSPSTIRKHLPERPKTSITYNSNTMTKMPLMATMALTSRKRAIADYSPKLPQVNNHDPRADPPPINDTIVDKYGLQHLTESRHVRQENINEHLKGLFVVSPFKKDIGADYRNFKQNYYLDPVTPAKVEKERPKLDLLRIPSDEDDAALSTATGHYIFTLVNGIPVSSSQEFQAFKRYHSTVWESIEIILNMLTPICEQYGMSEIKVDGNIITEFTKYEPDEIPVARLFRCFMTLPRTKLTSTKVGFGFVGPKAEEKAATFIQSIWRGYNARRVVRMIRRQNAAAKTIQDQWRVYKNWKLFIKALEHERQKKMLRFESFQNDSSAFRLNEPHVLVHLVSSFDSIEVGRLTFLKNKNTTLVLYLRKAPPPEISNIIRNIFTDTQRLHVLTSSLRLPNNFIIEDLFASDPKIMKQIKLIAGPMPIYIFPTITHYALVDSSIKLNALALAPSPSRVQMYTSRESMRRILKNTGSRLFESSLEIFDNDTLCSELAGLAVSNIQIQTWVLRTNDESIGWLNMSDFVLIEQLRAHRNTLTEDDLLDKSFRDVLKQNISKDLKHVLNTTGQNTPENFIHNFFTVGGLIEAGPLHLKSGPAVAFFVPPVGRPSIVGSWETLYISQYEPFATIHPAFTVAREKLKKKTLKIAAECSSKRLIGINVIKYFYSARNVIDSENFEDQYKMKLTPDNLVIGKIDESMNQFFAQALLKTSFDEESMSIGPSKYAYVQRRFEMPVAIDLATLREKFENYSIPIDLKVFFLPSFNDNSIYSFLVAEDTPEKLVNLVYNTLVTLVDYIFEIEKYPKSEVLKYLASIEFLKQQYDTTKELSSTLLMKKIKTPPIRKSLEQRLFQFDKLNDENENNPEMKNNEEVQEDDSSFLSTIE